MAIAIAWLVLILGQAGTVASARHDISGQARFAGLPVPGATVTARRADITQSTITDEKGTYRISGLTPGAWTLTVELSGFAALTRSVTVGPGSPPEIWDLALAPMGEPAPAGAKVPVFQTAAFREIQASPPEPRVTKIETPLPEAAGLLINGSVQNAAASAFSQPTAFGNNRRRVQRVYTGGLDVLLADSAWNARPFAFGGNRRPSPDFRDVHVSGSLGGPLRWPTMRTPPNFYVGYQFQNDHSSQTRSGIVPTELERLGDFSQSRTSSGAPVQITNPATGLPFDDARIPPDRRSPQATSLLALYPLPNFDGARFNYQTPSVSELLQHSVEARLTHQFAAGNVLVGNIGWQQSIRRSTTLLGFAEKRQISNLTNVITWVRRVNQRFTIRPRFELRRRSLNFTPPFAFKANVSGEAGIAGNSQDPESWGPPRLIFSSGMADLAPSEFERDSDMEYAGSIEGYYNRGRHNLTFGSLVQRRTVDIFSQPGSRGRFSFDGSATGNDFADFLFGIPSTSALSLGAPERFLRGYSTAVYFSDDLRLHPGLTVILGVRWEYESPFSESRGRLSNLDILPGFGDAAPVIAADGLGQLTGKQFPSSLLRSDWAGVQPRLGLTWRPFRSSSLVIRGGYGIYRTAGLYEAIARRLAWQPPQSQTFSVANDPTAPFTLANGFLTEVPGVSSTFAVDPELRVGYAQTWNVSAQHNLPASLTAVVTYAGVTGSRLPQQILPNTYPAGAVDPCASCPSGFIYLMSNGTSRRHSAQFVVRRRLVNGFTAGVEYTLAHSVDNASSFGVAGGGADGGSLVPQGLPGAAIAQDWLAPDAELGPSSFDQRHRLAVQAQYTIGTRWRTVNRGLFARLVANWTAAGDLAVGSGLPLTPIYLAPVEGTGIIGLRPSLTGVPVSDVAAGAYLNPAAYGPPEPGQWGTVKRNSARGPSEFAFDARFMRTFSLGDRLRLEWRIDVNNLINRVVYSGIDVVVGSPQFGLPNRVASMRTIRTALRLRF